jgi:hypothetical protein
LPAIVLAVPFAPLPLRWADPLWVGLTVAAFAFALLKTNRVPALLGLLSMAGTTTMQLGQWPPLLCAGALMPATFGFVLAAKPTIAAALWAAFPSWRSVLAAGAFTIATVIWWPGWPREWFALLPAVPHMTPPVMRWGGPLILIALIQWRQPEARLLVALACVPQTPSFYEALPLFLISRTWTESITLFGLMAIVLLVRELVGAETWLADAQLIGDLVVWLIYLPCLVMVMRRRTTHLQVDSDG